MSDGVVNACAGPFGAFYAQYIDRPRLARPIGRLVWGIDVGPLYASIDAEVRALGAGATVLDVPCGAGLELRALRPEQDVRFLAADLEPKMLRRTAQRARQQSLAQVETVQADMLALPFADASADVALAYSGLHMVADPRGAIAELARCVKPGGRLAGSSFVTDGSRRQRAVFAIGRRLGEAGLLMSTADLMAWLDDAGFADVAISGHGFVTFTATRA